MTLTENFLKTALLFIAAVFIIGFLFRILFKVGLILLMVLGIIYLVKKIF